MAPHIAEQEQQQAAQHAQQASEEHQTAHIQRQQEAIRHLGDVINFRKARAAEHDDLYFLILIIPAVVVDFADAFDLALGGIVEIFTFWVAWPYTALFVFGPRHYVWRDTEGVLIKISHNAIKLIPFMRSLPAHTTVVARNWFTSIVHKEADLAYAAVCEVELAILLHGKKGKKGK